MSPGSGAAALYYVTILVLGQYSLLNLTLAIVLDGSTAVLSKDYENQQIRFTLLKLFAKL